MAPYHTFRDEHYGVVFYLFLQFTSPRPRFPPHPSTCCTPHPPFGTLSPCRFDTFSYNRVWASFMPCHCVSLFNLGMRILTSSSERLRSSGSPKSRGPPDALGWTSGWARLLLKLAYSYFSSKILQSGEDIWLPITRIWNHPVLLWGLTNVVEFFSVVFQHKILILSTSSSSSSWVQIYYPINVQRSSNMAQSPLRTNAISQTAAKGRVRNVFRLLNFSPHYKFLNLFNPSPGCCVCPARLFPTFQNAFAHS